MDQPSDSLIGLHIAIRTSKFHGYRMFIKILHKQIFFTGADGHTLRQIIDPDIQLVQQLLVQLI